jgi:uncharacterized membrane protein
LAGEWASTCSAIINPGVAGGILKFGSRDLALTAISASLYAAINTTQTSMGGPITYGPIQLRLADSLIALSALFGWPFAIGVSVGCFSNAYYWFDPADVVVGPIVNLVAALVILYLKKHRFIACAAGGLTVGFPIGFYLFYLCVQGNVVIQQQVPSLPGLSLPAWSAFVIFLSISSLITVGLIGSILIEALGRSGIVGQLKSRELRVSPTDKSLSHETFELR